MSQRFHSFRAPAHTGLQPTKRNPLPLPSVSSRKTASRYLRDVMLGVRSLSKRQLTIVAATFALVILICCRSAFPRYASRHRNSYPLQTTDCACPVPKTSEVFAEQILIPAGFVARVQTRHSLPGFLVLDILELYRGHARAVQWPVLVHQSLATVCYAEESYHDDTAATPEWLVVAGGITSPSVEVVSALSSSTDRNNFSVLLPAAPRGPRCERQRSKRSGDTRTPGDIVWMTPWHGLSKTVAGSIVHDSGNEALWWRTNDASLEFKNSIRRAVETSDATSSTVVSDLGTTGVTSSGSMEWWLKEGVSVIAACKDRTQTLQQAILTWLAANGVNEIVVVDWSSNPPIQNSLNDEILNDPRLVLVRAEGQSQWILSRAYNLAARSASFSRLMKVDCDTVLSADFFSAHDLKPDQFFAGDWRQLESGATNALHTNGLLFVNRDDFLAVGGFDERVTTYGWDDSDIAQRLSNIRSPQAIAHDKVQHISHSASLRVTNQHRNSLLPPSNPFAAAVEIQRNRLLLTKYTLPRWKPSSSHIIWNVCPGDRDIPEQFQQGESPVKSPVFMTVRQANDVAAASALVSDADAEEVAKRSIRLILRRVGLPLLPKTLTLNFYKTLIAKVANPDKYAEVVLSLRGGCMSKLLAHASSKEATIPSSLTPPDSSTSDLFVPPPYPYTGWRLEELWLSSDTDCSCKFSTVFDATDEEVLSEWLDNGNHVESTLSNPAVHNLEQNVTDVLRLFSDRSAVKNVSVDVAKWYQTLSSSRILIADTSCATDPVRLSSSDRKRIRQSLTELVPSKVILNGIRNSLSTKSMTILDSPLLDIQVQSKLVSAFRARQINESLTSTESATMLSRWTANSPATEASTSHSLNRRAHAVMLSAYLGDNSWDKSRMSSSDTSKLEEILSKVVQVFERLFQGCRASPFDYIEAYPELAVIIAGFFSARLCL